MNVPPLPLGAGIDTSQERWLNNCSVGLPDVW